MGCKSQEGANLLFGSSAQARGRAESGSGVLGEEQHTLFYILPILALSCSAVRMNRSKRSSDF